MKLTKYMLILFLVRVLIPLGGSIKYEARDYELLGDTISLTLMDGSHVIVPTMWTIIEQIKEKK